jgi:hypothetical protein
LHFIKSKNIKKELWKKMKGICFAFDAFVNGVSMRGARCGEE